MKILISKDVLYDYYINQDLTTKEIGNIYKCNRQTIAKIIKEYGIPYKKNRKRCRKYNLEGQKIGKLMITSLSHRDNKERLYVWNAICDCGEKIKVKLSSLRRKNHPKTCCRNCSKKKPRYDFGEITGYMMAHIKCNATRRDIQFNITGDYIWSLFLIQDKKCALTRIELNLGDNIHNRNRTASLDRIDSIKGYIEGNVQWVHEDINVMKMDLDQDYFIEMCKLVTKANLNK